MRDLGARQHGAWYAASVLKAVIKRVQESAAAWSAVEAAELAPLIQAAAAVDDEALAAQLRTVTGAAEDPLTSITTTDHVGPRLREVLGRAGEAPAAVAALVDLLTGLAATGKPSKRWLTSGEAVREQLDDPSRLAADLLDAVLDAPDVENRGAFFFHHKGANETIALAITRFAALLADPSLLPRLRRLAVKGVTVIGGEYGHPRSLKLANAAVQAIAEVGAPGSITELLALERTVRHGSLLKQIGRAVDALAEAQGVTRDELLERAVETHGLDAQGQRDVQLSRGVARITAGSRGATLTFVEEEGAPRKSFPAAVKEADGETLAELREEIKGIRKTISSERHRLDGLMAVDRRWSLDEWRSLYLAHPVTGRLARELIWGFGDVVGVPVDGSSVRTSAGEEVAIQDGAEVRLWHPVHALAEDVGDWRRHLLDHEIAQPFKQAFRETYALTPAEIETREYSNRFASHVFRQVQARALMKGRGWSSLPLAWWDDGIDHGVARWLFEPFGIRADFYYDPIYDVEPQGGDLYPYCTSDQVRFFDAVTERAIALADVPLLVFTEAMRDVDLFIGVTSIGNDPEWLDHGEGRQFDTYWHGYSFGELTEAAKIRREVLERLLPRLAIADRCELAERYLVVRGELRTYKIHLGSGNILMLPNDQYLCIVAARDNRAGKLFLPFDDDPGLSLILSKAFMLAGDTKIEDRSITAQIKRR